MTWRNSRTGAAVSARSTGPLAVSPEAGGDGSINLTTVWHDELRERRELDSAPMAKLLNEHADLSRNLSLPHAELWVEQYARDQARIKAVWKAIQRRRQS